MSLSTHPNLIPSWFDASTMVMLYALALQHACVKSYWRESWRDHGGSEKALREAGFLAASPPRDKAVGRGVKGRRVDRRRSGHDLLVGAVFPLQARHPAPRAGKPGSGERFRGCPGPQRARGVGDVVRPRGSRRSHLAGSLGGCGVGERQDRRGLHSARAGARRGTGRGAGGGPHRIRGQDRTRGRSVAP